MKKSIIVAIVFLMISPFAFSQSNSTTPTTSDDLITISQSKLIEIITARVNKAVDEAVAVAVKEERAKNIALQEKLDLTILDKETLNNEFKTYRKSAVQTHWIVGVVSFSTGMLLALVLPAVF